MFQTDKRPVGRPPYERIPMNLREIEELLFIKRWTQFDLARELGISRSLITRWFLPANSKEHRNINPDHVRKMKSWLTSARREYAKELARAAS